VSPAAGAWLLPQVHHRSRREEPGEPPIRTPSGILGQSGPIAWALPPLTTSPRNCPIDRSCDAIPCCLRATSGECRTRRRVVQPRTCLHLLTTGSSPSLSSHSPDARHPNFNCDISSAKHEANAKWPRVLLSIRGARQRARRYAQPVADEPLPNRVSQSDPVGTLPPRARSPRGNRAWWSHLWSHPSTFAYVHRRSDQCNASGRGR
jgi:hypothetical protein